MKLPKLALCRWHLSPYLELIHLIIVPRTGLPLSFGAIYDSASDSEEEEDEADEDSNGKWILCLFQGFQNPSASRIAEEYYKNDYPDEIDSSESSGKRPNPRRMVLRHVLFSRRIP